jgi:hypothetical protein
VFAVDAIRHPPPPPPPIGAEGKGKKKEEDRLIVKLCLLIGS